MDIVDKKSLLTFLTFTVAVNAAYSERISLFVLYQGFQKVGQDLLIADK